MYMHRCLENSLMREHFNDVATMRIAFIMSITLGCWQSAQAFLADASPPEGPEAQLASYISNVKSGPEFVAALANPSVRFLRISSPEVNVHFTDWNSPSFKPPLVLKRDMVIEGNPEMPFWPTVNLRGAPGMVRMAHNVTMTVRNVFASGFRDNPTRAPGLDFLLPSLEGEISYLLVGPAAGNISLCFPNDYQMLDFGLLGQMGRPGMFPGRNEIRYNESQEGCINDTSLPPMRQCWPQKTRVVDLAAEGADYDINRDMNTPNNLMIHLRNLTLFCDAVVDPTCLRNGEPLVCYLEARKKYMALHGNSQQLQLKDEGGGLTGARRVAMICATTIAGTLLLIVAGRLTVTWLRRCRQQRRGKVYEGSCGEGAGGGASPCRGADNTEDVDRQKAAPVIQQYQHPDDSVGVGTVLQQQQQQPPAPVAAGLETEKDARILVRAKSLDGGTTTDAPGGEELSQMLAPDEAGLEPTKPKSGKPRPAEKALADAKVRAQQRVLPVKTAAALAMYDKPVTPLTPPHPEVVLDVRIAFAAATATKDDSAAAWKADSNSNDFVVGQGRNSYSSASGDGGKGDAGGDGSSNTEPPTVELLPVVLGKGAFGRVVEGLYGGRRVAVKLLASDVPWEVLQQQKADSMPNNFLKSFEQEMQVLSRCQHPNVVQLLAACVTPPRLCLVIELMETSLERLMYCTTSETVMPLAKVLRIGIDVANALAYLHPTVVHRDLKPANVLMDNAASDRPVVKLSDFGLSRLRVTVKSTKAPEAGTPPYMPPECFDVLNKHVTHQADIYSLGVLIWEMLTGRRPWEGMGNVAIAFMVTYKGLRLPLEGLPYSRCPAKLSRLLASCWEADPARRPAAAEVAKELTLVLEQLQ